jgi:hypothetical protein
LLLPAPRKKHHRLTRVGSENSLNLPGNAGDQVWHVTCIQTFSGLCQRSLPATCTRLHASSPGRRIYLPGRDGFIFAGFSLGRGITDSGDAMMSAKQIDCSAPLT